MENQRGSAIIMLFVAVALFAALAFAFTRGSRTTSGFLTDEQTRTYANEIIAYGNEVRTAVKRLQLRGCKDTDISFENTVLAGYANTNNPPDSCKVFHVSGGGLTYKPAPAPFYVNDASTLSNKYSFQRGIEWAGNGTTCGTSSCTEIVMILNSLDQKTCTKINEILGYSTGAMPTDEFGGNTFTGTFLHDNVLGEEATMVAGKQSACVFKSSNGRYIYAAMLLAR